MKMNAIVGQSGGPTSVINASLAGVVEACVSRGIPTVYGMAHGVEGLLNGQYCDLTEKLATPLEIELLKRTPSSYLGSCRYKLPDPQADPQVYEKLFGILKQLRIGFFFYIGGNDSMDTIGKLAAYGRRVGSEIRFMGVPKTIDNDLMRSAVPCGPFPDQGRGDAEGAPVRRHRGQRGREARRRPLRLRAVRRRAVRGRFRP